MSVPEPAAKGNPGTSPGGSLAGIGLAATAFALFTVMDTLVKWLSQGWPIPQIIIGNVSFGLVPVLIWCAATGRWHQLRTRRPLIHMARGAIGSLGALGAFYGYSRMALADAYAINFTAPLIITALSVPLLGETVGWRRWTAVAVGFAGVLVMLRPGAGMLDPGALGLMIGAFAYALSMVIIRRFGSTESGLSFTVWGFCTQILLLAPTLPFLFVPPALGDLALMALSGTLGGTALLLQVTAFRTTPSAVVAPFQYTQLIWGTLTGWLVWGDLPTGYTVAGAGIVIGSGLYILHREAKRRRLGL
jgi:drug/metabolite transporter (DMT)-like permease